MSAEVVIAGLLSLLGATWTALIAGYYRGDLIPGHVWRREIRRGDTATTQAERNASSINSLAKAHEAERDDHAKALTAKDQEIAALHKQLGERPNAPTG